MNKDFLAPLMVVSWSVYFVLCDMLIKSTGSPLLTGLLLRVGTFIGLSVTLLFFGKSNVKKIKKRHLSKIIITGIMAFGYDLLINIGLKHSSATAGTALLKTEIVFVFFFGILFYKNKVKKIQVLCSSIMMIGAILIVVGSSNGVTIDIWALFFVLSALLNAFCAFMLKNIQMKDGPSGFQVAYVNNIISMLLYGILYFVIRDSDFLVISKINVFCLIGCIICQILLIVTYYSALGLYPVWVVKTIILLIPVLTLFIQTVFFNFYISLTEIIGVVLTIMGGTFMMLITNQKTNHKA